MKNVTPAESTADLAGRRWTFGPAVLDERSLELEVAGQPAKLERKPLEVLIYLLHHAGEVVTKDDLADALWPGRILTETVLTRCISLLRTALQDDARTLIRTVHGFGYRLVADVRVEVSADSGPPALDFRAGDHPPQRPQWKLVERLGTGGHGEAWLARHEKTGDARVFKFAVDAHALSSLKREITLYRLMHDSLGQRTGVARIFEWNLTEPPYFIEMEHVAGGNLQTWSEAQGGLAGIPLATRLELVARIADAIAAAHSVGALHKDLKPGNVLVHVENGAPTIRLCDFGSGGVLDPQRLEALGITRQGFTKTLSDAAGATPLYVAPEVMAGQPFTIQADIYALGILLYQVVVGDLRKALAPGWESDVADELLREDISLAAAGNPAKRLTDAAQLAERLRSLERRRDARAAELAARLRAERARRALDELRRTKVYVAALLALTAFAVVGGVIAYQARDQALAATGTAEAISDFLMEDVLRVDSSLVRTTDASYEALLGRAAAKVDERLKGHAKAAARVHWLLGRRQQEIGQFDAAARHFEQAVRLSTKLYGREAYSTLLAMDHLAWAHAETGRNHEALSIFEDLRSLWESRPPPADLGILLVRTRFTRTLFAVGAITTAEAEVRAVLREIETTSPSPHASMPLFKQWLGTAPPTGTAPLLLAAYANLLLAANILEETGESQEEVEPRLRQSLTTFSTVLGEANDLTALTNFALAAVLAEKGKYEDAEIFASRARNYFDKSLSAKHHARGLSRIALGRLRREQRQMGEAVNQFQEAVGYCINDSGCPTRVRALHLWDLGRAYIDDGREQSAIRTLRSALALQEGLRGPGHGRTLAIRAALADALRQAGNLDEAADVLSKISQESITALLPFQQGRADVYRAQGLLLLEAGEFDQARAALKESLRIVDHRLGAAHWRTERARTELATAK